MSGDESLPLRAFSLGAHGVREMPRYRCHKYVHALTIARVDTTATTVLLSFAEQGYAPAEVKPELFARYTPKRGDYYVVYEDGYQSISPKAAFEAGYTRIPT